MSFSPLIHPDHVQSRVNQYAASPAISEVLTRCFDSDILPSRASHPRRLLRSEVSADLYTSEREWQDPVDFDPGGVDRHENYLDHIFWDAKLANSVVCDVGSVGSGKSTLVDYYLRCQCPNDGQRSDDFDKRN